MDYNLLDEGPKPQHVDRKSLYTNLEERIKYLHGVLDWNSADIEALKTGAKYLKPLIPTVAHLVYKKILEFDVTARAINTRSTVDETEPKEGYYSMDTPEIKRRKMFLRWYLVRICRDPTKMEFWRYLNKIGMMHSGQVRMARLNIEYIHINALLGYVQDVVTEELLSHPQLSLRSKIALLRAIAKVLCIQNDLFARWYVRDGKEYMEEMDMEAREGLSKAGNSASEEANQLNDDQASTADSLDSFSDSLSGSKTTKTNGTNSTAHSISHSMGSACPFSPQAKGSSETKIWAN